MKSIALMLLFAIISGAESSYSQQVAFPLHVGDRWEYSPVLSGTLTRVRIARDTVMPNAQRYAVFESTLLDSFWPYDFTYLRQAGNVVYHYNPASQSEEMLYRFDASPSDTLLKVPATSDTLAIIFDRQSTGALFGVQRRHWFFGIYPMHIIDGGETRRITDSLGLTDVTVANGGSTLRGALIDGKLYGDFSSVLEATRLPGQATLRQNYPNPFNPSTTVKYELPTSTEVRLSVYDVLGREVSVLVNERRDAGVHEVRFNGSGFASGIFLYRLQAGSFTQTRKIVLLR